MELLMRLVFIILPFILSSCKKDESLSPPKNSETVSIAIQLPQDIEVDPVKVMYRSNICLKIRSKGNGNKYEVPGFHLNNVLLEKNKDKYISELLIPSDGGGRCQWKLSNVTLRIKYKKSLFENDLNESLGSGVIFIFDENSPQRDDGVYEYVTGDLVREKKYFPWIDEDFMNVHGHSKRLIAYGGGLFTTYKLNNTKKISFTVISHPELIIYSKSPKVKQEGSHTQFTYSDGTVVADGSSFPNYEKLLSLIKK